MRPRTQVLGVRPNNVEVSCGSGARRLSETSESDTYEYQVVVNGNEMELEEIKDAAKVYFAQSSKAEFDLGMALTAVTVDGELVNVDVNVCRAWQPEQCGINPSNIRAFCDASYNPTVGVDSVSGGVKVTATFPVAPGLATKNSAVNFLAGKGYDPDNFGKAPLPPFFSLLTARDFASHCVYPRRTS